MGAAILQHLWNLRTNPFSPAMDSNGVPLVNEAFRATLKPALDQRVIEHYFDVYDWSASPIIREFAELGDCFPSVEEFEGEAVFVLISGLKQTGRDSLANLLLHRIQSLVAQPPIVVDVKLPGRDKAQNLNRVAHAILMRLSFGGEAGADKQTVVASLEREYSRATEQEARVKHPTYANCFAAYQEILRPLARNIILRIVEGGDHDNWKLIYESARQCCSWVVVLTDEPVYAEACYNAMSSDRRISWIQAQRLDHAMAERFLRARLDKYRFRPDMSLHPFAEATLDVLFAPGTHPDRRRGAVVHPIGWLRKSLNAALEDRLRQLEAAIPDDKALGRITPEQASISSEGVKAVRERLNAGRLP
jgi:hypothetical protein